MEKVTKWLKTCFGYKKNKHPAPAQKVKKEKFISSSGGRRRDISHIATTAVAATEQSKHAIAVAAASVAAAEAAIVSAVAATAVLRKSTDQSRVTPIENWAAIKIQSVYRGHLARRALKALRSLVKIQALFRGYMVRRRVAVTLHKMRALIRAQACVYAHKARGSSYSIETDKTKQLSKSRSYGRRQVSYFRDDLTSKLMSSTRQFRQLPPRLSLQDSRNYRRSGWGVDGEESCPSYMAETESFRAKLKYSSLKNAIARSIVANYRPTMLI